MFFPLQRGEFEGFLRLFIPDMLRCFIDWRTKLGVADLAAEDGGADGEGRGQERDEQDQPGAAADPVGPPAEEDQPGDAAQARDIDEGGGFLGHLFVHFHGDVAPGVERGLDLARVEAVVGAVPGLHHEGGGEVAQQAEGKGDGEDGGIPGDQRGGQEGSQEENQSNRQMVEHHVEVLGLPKCRDHHHRVEGKGVFSNVKQTARKS